MWCALWSLVLVGLLGCGPGTPAAEALDGPPVVETPPKAEEVTGGEDTLVPGVWRVLRPGLEVAEFEAAVPSDIGDSRIRVVRVDPAHHELVLASARLGDGVTHTARGWSQREGFLVATNPGMFHPDGRSTGFMQVGAGVVNPTVNGDKAILAFDPGDEAVPPVRIIDRECDDFAQLRLQYRQMVQSIRMLSCTGQNVWSAQERRCSHAVIGTDRQGRALLIHARSPWSTHVFVEQLRSLPIDLDRLQYGEGGPEAQLYVAAGDFQAEWWGSFETGFNENDDNDRAWPIPNILGVRPRK
ncbi:MAG: phosphodiester glycosidase family protein [Deltaproteobacteria bacterium]|nr:phosphodiester glycosidase family protein [Deltaproteobacteria bacterium]